MTTRDTATDGQVEKTNNNNGCGNASTNSGHSNSTNSSSWFRSIPRRIRRFILKQNRQPSQSSGQRNNQTTNISDLDINTAASNPDYADQTIVGDGERADETNLYSMVDYMGNDEEVAMIRACSQMAK